MVVNMDGRRLFRALLGDAQRGRKNAIKITDYFF